jgi:HK97 family phage prohead protease
MDTRAWRADFDTSDAEGRIIRGVAVPFNSPTTIAENGRVFDETFKPGSTREWIATRGDRIRLLGFHDSRAWPIGKPFEMADTQRGMTFAAKISDTRDGNDALTLIRDGAIDGVSVGFGVREGGDTWNAAQTERTINRADIHEFSLVNFPAYDRARVESVRAMSVDGGIQPADMPAHEFVDNGGTGQCVVCNLTMDEGNHTSMDAAVLELDERGVDEIAVMRLRLDVLRLEAIKF